MADARHHDFGPSSLARREACPGSWHVERFLPSPPASDDAERGTRLHEAVAAWIAAGAEPTCTDLQDDDFECVRRMFDCFAQERDALAEECGAAPEVFAERRLGYAAFGEEVFFGTCDVLLLDRASGRGTVIDWKTGARQVPAAEENLQGAAYALAAMQAERLSAVKVVFFNPGPLCRQRTSYTFTDAAALGRTVMGVVAKCQEPDAPCRDGEHCRYCKGAEWGTCPVAAGKLAAVSASLKDGESPLESWDGDRLGALWRDLSLFASARFQARVRDELMKRIEAAHAPVGGWEIKVSSGRRSFGDVPGMLEAVAPLLPPERMALLATYSYTAVEKALAEALVAAGRCASAKEAKGAAAEALSAFLAAAEPVRGLQAAKEGRP